MAIKKSPNLFIPILSLVFFFSGFAALIYQVVWQRLLTLHYGVGSISTTLIIGVYMAGLGIGGWLGGHISERIQRRVMVFFGVELGIGIFGLFSLPFVNFLGRVTAGSPYFLSALYMFFFLCIPTFLMGITLPLLTKIFNRYLNDFFGTVSFLYFINTIGAAAGAFFTGYLLISFFGMNTAVYVAACIDISLACMVWFASRLKEAQVNPSKKNDGTVQSYVGLGRWAYLIIFITGFLALGYEIVWYRLIGVLVKDSAYVFSTVLSVYLLGVGLGSLAVNRFLVRRPTVDRRNLFFTIQLFIGVYILASMIGYYYLTRDTQFGYLTRASFDNYLHPDPELILYLPKRIQSFALLYSYLDIFLWPMFFLFVPTLLMGAGFPLVSYLAITYEEKEGNTVGTIYFFNILGNVLGATITGFLILPALGSEITMLVMALTSATGLIFINRLAGKTFPIKYRAILMLAVFIVSIYFFPQRGDIYRLIHPPAGGRIQIIDEGVDAVVVSYHNNGPTVDYINGQEHGQFGTEWYYAWVLEAASYARSLDNVLVIGFGSGTFPAVLQNIDSLGKMTVVELSPTLIKNQKDIPFYRQMLADPRLDLVIDDGRRYLLQRPEKYNLILMDPIRTTTSHANNLHSRQFFELIRQKLKPGGVFLIGGLNEERVVSKTIASVFKFVRVYELFTLGSDEPPVKNLERQEQILNSLKERDRTLVKDYVQKTYRGDQSYILELSSGYPVNEEWMPNTEYYLGLRMKERLRIIR